MDKTIGVRLPDWLVDEVDSAADIRMETRSAFVRRVLANWIAENRGTNGRPPRKAHSGGGSRPRRNARGRK